MLHSECQDGSLGTRNREGTSRGWGVPVLSGRERVAIGEANLQVSEHRSHCKRRGGRDG